jgi:hypothetical protein
VEKLLLVKIPYKDGRHVTRCILVYNKQSRFSIRAVLIKYKLPKQLEKDVRISPDNQIAVASQEQHCDQ